MSGARRIGSLVFLGGVLLGAVSCSAAPETETSDSSSTQAPVTATARPGTTEPAEGSGGTTPGTTDGTAPPTTERTTTTEATTATSGATTDPSVPIVDPASVEAFCALDDQLDDLSDAQMNVDDLDDPEALRLAFAKFLTDNAAVIDQYIAAAPPEIEASVDESMAQLRAAVDDAATFEDTLSGNTEASDRVSDFIDANCPS